MSNIENGLSIGELGLAPLREPEYVSYSAWIEHTPFAFWVVDAVRPSLFAELGTHQGQSYMAFCQAIQSLDTSCRALAVDTWRGDEHAGFYGQEVMDALRAVHDPKYRSFSQLLQMTFTEASLTVEDGSVDLLHIDGRHFADDVQADFDEWLPKMSDRGVVLMHDTQVRNNGFGVHEVWANLSQKYPSFEFHHGHGLGVLAVGSTIPERVRAFLEAGQDADQAVWLRSFFSRLGAGVTMEYERNLAREQERRIPELEQQVFDLSAQRVALEEQLVVQDQTGRRELTIQKQKVRATKAELQALRSSTSWKVTKPVRLVGRVSRSKRAGSSGTTSKEHS